MQQTFFSRFAASFPFPTTHLHAWVNCPLADQGGCAPWHCSVCVCVPLKWNNFMCSLVRVITRHACPLLSGPFSPCSSLSFSLSAFLLVFPALWLSDLCPLCGQFAYHPACQDCWLTSTKSKKASFCGTRDSSSQQQHLWLSAHIKLLPLTKHDRSFMQRCLSCPLLPQSAAPLKHSEHCITRHRRRRRERLLAMRILFKHLRATTDPAYHQSPLVILLVLFSICITQWMSKAKDSKDAACSVID